MTAKSGPPSFPVTKRNRVRRLPDKARYDEAAVHAVLDAGLVAHAGFVQDGAPVVIPMLYAREGATLLLHGAGKARVMKLLASGAPVCVNVTLLDGIVAARSAFNSSMNYRSAVVFGRGRVIEGEAARLHALERISEHVFAGRWAELRAPHPRELRMTGVVEVAIESASAKIAAGPPNDEPDDYALAVWAGVIPIATTFGAPRADDRVPTGVEPSRAIASLEGRRL
jgi:nitroimidazol reductase NimA-like FMN-containing flavoprotein (pyridoxamine 5'-phosphate oxidase superfamily)